MLKKFKGELLQTMLVVCWLKIRGHHVALFAARITGWRCATKIEMRCVLLVYDVCCILLMGPGCP